VTVRRPQRGDVARAQRTDIRQPAAAPAERLSPEPLDEQVGGEARMASVPVREGVDRDQAMVKPDRRLVVSSDSRN
jgi:hypothetical protein